MNESAFAPRCGPGQHCVTCSDEAIEFEVLRMDLDGLARCRDEAGNEQDVEVALVGAVGPGDRVLVHAGVALLRVAGAGEGRP